MQKSRFPYAKNPTLAHFDKEIFKQLPEKRAKGLAETFLKFPAGGDQKSKALTLKV